MATFLKQREVLRDIAWLSSQGRRGTDKGNCKGLMANPPIEEEKYLKLGGENRKKIQDLREGSDHYSNLQNENTGEK